MPDYSKGSIYKIVCNNTGLIYIGSTCQPLHQRLAGHVRSYNKDKYYSSSEIIAGGNYSIILIEEYQCQNKQQLLRKEREYIESLECVNKRCPISSDDEKKEKRKEYREINKKAIQEWRDINKETRLQKQREYHQLNRENILEKQKQYKSQKVICSICSKEMRKDTLTKHKIKLHKPDFTLIQ
jgi:hypothetical protein